MPSTVLSWVIPAGGFGGAWAATNGTSVAADDSARIRNRRERRRPRFMGAPLSSVASYGSVPGSGADGRWVGLRGQVTPGSGPASTKRRRALAALPRFLGVCYARPGSDVAFDQDPPHMGWAP